jgi:RimJ/RimL family protein N-acetyltransferase
MMLAHAFDVWQCIAVEFRTHRLNTQSRNAIERLGAQLDGILRAHSMMPNGTLRDTALYSIVAAEWPTIKVHLDFKITESAKRS